MHGKRPAEGCRAAAHAAQQAQAAASTHPERSSSVRRQSYDRHVLTAQLPYSGEHTRRRATGARLHRRLPRSTTHCWCWVQGCQDSSIPHPLFNTPASRPSRCWTVACSQHALLDFCLEPHTQRRKLLLDPLPHSHDRTRRGPWGFAAGLNPARGRVRVQAHDERSSSDSRRAHNRQ